MTAKCDQEDRVHSKRNWKSSEKGGEMSYNLRKRSKSDHTSRVLSDSVIHQMLSRKEETIMEEIGPQSTSQCQMSSVETCQTPSLDFTPLSQDELRKLFGARLEIPKIAEDSEESEDEEEEGERLTMEKFKQSAVYQRFMNDVDNYCKRNNSMDQCL